MNNLLTYFYTLRIDVSSWRAISLFINPSATSCRTLDSLGVKLCWTGSLEGSASALEIFLDCPHARVKLQRDVPCSNLLVTHPHPFFANSVIIDTVHIRLFCF